MLGNEEKPTTKMNIHTQFYMHKYVFRVYVFTLIVLFDSIVVSSDATDPGNIADSIYLLKSKPN